MRRDTLGAALLLLLALTTASASSDCIISSSDDGAVVEVVCTAGFSANVTDDNTGAELTWAEAREELLANATNVAIAMADLKLTSEDVPALIYLLGSLQSAKAVSVELERVEATDLAAAFADVLKLPGEADYLIDIRDCSFIDNQLVGAAALSSYGLLNATVRVTTSAFFNNQLALAGAVGVKGPLSFNFDIADSSIAGNQVILVGAAGVSEDLIYTTTIQPTTNISGNHVLTATLLALGGSSNSTLDNEGEGAANAARGMNLVVPGSPLVSSVVTAILDAGYSAAFDWASVVNTVQGELCASIPTLGVNLTAAIPADASQLRGLADLLLGLVCSDDGKAALPLGGLVDAIIRLIPSVGGDSSSGTPGSLDLAALSPIINAITQNPAALAAGVKLLPQLLPLLTGGGSGGVDLSSLLGLLGGGGAR